MNGDKSAVIRDIGALLLEGKEDAAHRMIRQAYPHAHLETEKRTYTLAQKMEQFAADGFIDRYTGQRLVNPGILKIISRRFPDDFPYQSHWKMDKTHMAYWELIPTIDHICPIAKGGEDHRWNWVTTSMKNNLIKRHYTIEELQWKLYPKGNWAEWDGLTNLFLKLVDQERTLLEDNYIKGWYNVSNKYRRAAKTPD